MTTTVFTDAYVAINGVEYSDKCVQVSLPIEREMLDATTFGGDTRRNKGGLKAWSMDFQFLNDLADNGLDEALWAIFDAGTEVTFAIRPVDDSKSATNPEWTGTGVMRSITPISGGVGELLGHTVAVSSVGTLTRAVS